MWLDRLFRTLPPAEPGARPPATAEDERTDAIDLDENTVVSMRPPVVADDATLTEADVTGEPDSTE